MEIFIKNVVLQTIRLAVAFFSCFASFLLFVFLRALLFRAWGAKGDTCAKNACVQKTKSEKRTKAQEKKQATIRKRYSLQLATLHLIKKMLRHYRAGGGLLLIFQMTALSAKYYAVA